jgi:hypothetical protein
VRKTHPEASVQAMHTPLRDCATKDVQRRSVGATFRLRDSQPDQGCCMLHVGTTTSREGGARHSQRGMWAGAKDTSVDGRPIAKGPQPVLTHLDQDFYSVDRVQDETHDDASQGSGDSVSDHAMLEAASLRRAGYRRQGWACLCAGARPPGRSACAYSNDGRK